MITPLHSSPRSRAGVSESFLLGKFPQTHPRPLAAYMSSLTQLIKIQVLPSPASKAGLLETHGRGQPRGQSHMGPPLGEATLPMQLGVGPPPWSLAFFSHFPSGGLWGSGLGGVTTTRGWTQSPSSPHPVQVTGRCPFSCAGVFLRQFSPCICL